MVGSPVNFDGTNDYLTRGAALSGAVDGKVILFSCWLRDLGAAGAERRLMTILSGAASSRLVFGRNASNQYFVIGRTSAPADILQGTEPVVADTDWHHLLISVNLASVGERAIYVDGVAGSPTWGPYSDNIIDLLPVTPEVLIGAYQPTPTLQWNGDVAELYFHTPATWFDPSTGGNINKFISAGGFPVDLGADGSAPLGVQPLIYLGGATSDWQTNLGTGGGFTENGALTDGQELPAEPGRKIILTRPA